MELIRSSTEGPARWYPPSRRSRTLRKQAESLQTDVDDSRVGARREDGCPPTAYTSRKEAFIVDLRVWSGQSLAPGVVPAEAGLVVRRARDVPAGQEEPVRHGVDVRVRDDLPARRLDLRKRGFLRQHRELAER